MRVVAFTGMPGAGKSEAVALARERGLPIVRMGDFVWAEARRRGLELTDENVGRIATLMRKEQGADHWAQQTADLILKSHASDRLVVIDGVRSLAEVQTLRTRLGSGFHLVAIEAPLEVRTRRLLARGRRDDVADSDLVRRRDEREREWGLEDAIRAADSRVANSGVLPPFRKAIGALLDRLTGTA